MNELTLARAQGAFHVASGVWPLVSMRTFEAVLGPKTDHWLVRSVAHLLVAAGATQVLTPDTPAGVQQSRRIGIGVAAALAAIDLSYAPRGRISRVYLVDAAAHLGWIAAWVAASRRG